MTTEIEALVIKVSADMDDLRSEVKKARVEVDKSNRKMEAGFKKLSAATKPLIKTFARIATAATAAAAAFVSVRAVVDSMNRVDALGKTADKLGVTTEALQSMRLAAELTGVAAGTLDMALQRMVRRVAEAAQGTGEAVKALDELGLVAADLAKLSPDEQMMRIADAMQGVTNQADRVRLAMKLFDSEGVALVNTLAGGSEALQQVAKDLEEMGAAISRVDAAKVEAANDAFTKMSVHLGAISDQIAIDIAVPLQAFVEELGEVLAAIMKAEDGTVAFGETVTTVLGGVLDLIQGVRTAALAFEQSQLGLAAVVLMISGNEEATEHLKEDAIALKKEWDALTSIAASTALEQRKAAIAMERQAKAAGDVKKAQGGDSEDGLGAQQRLDALRDSLKTESVLLVEAAHERLRVLDEAWKQELIGIEEFSELRGQLLEEADAAYALRLEELQSARDAANEVEETRQLAHVERMLGIEQSHLDATNKLWESGLRGRLQLASQFFGNFAPLMESESRKMFEIGKAGALAETAVNTSLGAIKAYQAMAGIPVIGPALGVAAAGAVVATGLQTANQIRSTQFGSAGSSGTNGPASTPTASQGAINGGGGGGGDAGGGGTTTTVFDINLMGREFSGESVRGLIERIDEEVGNNVSLRTS